LPESRSVRGLDLLVRIAVLALACSGSTSERSLPIYTVHRVSQPIPFGGQPGDASWRAAREARLVNSLTGGPNRYLTTARMLWDGGTLYVHFDCEDDQPWARPGRRDDDPIYEDEVVEVFLDPSGAGRDYAEIEISPANVRFDARFASRRSDLARARAWSSGARSTVSLARTPDGTVRGWSVELAIPLAQVRAQLPAAGERWRMNLYRLENQNRWQIAEGSAFSPPLRGDFHALDRFGWLIFE